MNAKDLRDIAADIAECVERVTALPGACDDATVRNLLAQLCNAYQTATAVALRVTLADAHKITAWVGSDAV